MTVTEAGATWNDWRVRTREGWERAIGGCGVLKQATPAPAQAFSPCSWASRGAQKSGSPREGGGQCEKYPGPTQSGCENTLEIRRYYVLYVLIYITYNTQGYYAKDTLVVYSYYTLYRYLPVYACTPRCQA